MSATKEFYHDQIEKGMRNEQSHKHGVMQAEGSAGAVGAAVASEGQGEANTCAGCTCGNNFRMTKNDICVDCLKPVIRV